jgi:hypothetical protein
MPRIGDTVSYPLVASLGAGDLFLLYKSDGSTVHINFDDLLKNSYEMVMTNNGVIRSGDTADDKLFMCVQKTDTADTIPLVQFKSGPLPFASITGDADAPVLIDAASVGFYSACAVYNISSGASLSGRPVVVVDTDATPVGHVGAVRTNLMSYTIPGNKLEAGRGIYFDTGGQGGANAGAKGINVEVGGTLVGTLALAATGVADKWKADIRVKKVSTDVQRVSGTIVRNGGVALIIDTALALDDASNILVQFYSTGLLTNDVIQTYKTVKYE